MFFYKSHVLATLDQGVAGNLLKIKKIGILAWEAQER